jgi:hypothetical protein
MSSGRSAGSSGPHPFTRVPGLSRRPDLTPNRESRRS